MTKVAKQDSQAEIGKRQVQGKVISIKMNKTIVVLVPRRVKHAKYSKYLTRHTKLYAHDEENSCKSGDIVLIEQIRPISKTKTWQLIKIVENNLS